MRWRGSEVEVGCGGWRWCEVGVNYHTPEVKQKQMINYTNIIRINYANSIVYSQHLTSVF